VLALAPSLVGPLEPDPPVVPPADDDDPSVVNGRVNTPDAPDADTSRPPPSSEQAAASKSEEKRAGRGRIVDHLSGEVIP
jgi:hypothetical protein